MRRILLLAAGLSATGLFGLNDARAADLKRYLYVMNDDDRSIDVFDIKDNHKKVRSIAVDTDVKPLFRSISANVGTGKLFISDSKRKFVAAFDLLTDKMLWKRTYEQCTFPDRLNVTKDGSAVYVPCKENLRHVVLDPDTGDIVETILMGGRPHNSFTGESGKYMYLSGYHNTTLFVVDPTTRSKVEEIGGFSSPIRPFSVDREEKFFFANLNALLGFGVGDITNGKKLFEVSVTTPAERTMYPEAATELTHDGDPLSHGIAVRPGKKEVWFLDDAWGYLYVFDTSPLYQAKPQPPVLIASVPAFTDITKPWTETRWRWVAFSADGKYVYPSNGMVIDADTKEITDQKITPGEKLIEIDFDGDKPVLASGQNGGYYE